MSALIQASPLRRLLVANDDGDMRADLARGLATTLRCTVETARSLEAALASVESHPPDAVLVDPSWSGRGCLELVRALRASSHGPGLAVLVLGAAHDQPPATLREAGADASLCAPTPLRQIALALLGLTVERQARLRHARSRAAPPAVDLIPRATLHPTLQA